MRMNSSNGLLHFKVVLVTLFVVLTVYISLLSFKNGQQDISKVDSGLAQADTCGLAGLVQVTSPNGYSFTPNCAVSNAVQYDGDSRFTFFQLAQPYSSLPYIKTPNAAIKDSPDLAWSINLLRSSQLYLFFRRIPGVNPTIPSWATNYTRITPEGYSDVSQFMLRKNSENGLLGLYDIWKSNSATLSGRVNFGPASDTVQSNPAFSMYIVGIRPQTSATVSPTTSPTVNPTQNPTTSPSSNPNAGTLVTSGVVYNADSSANSSRSRNTSIRVPENVITPTQGWIAGRIKMGFPSTTTLTPDPNIFDLSESDQNSLFTYYDVASDTFHLERTHGGTVNSPKQTFSIGDVKTLVVTWSSSQIKISVDGGTFTTLNNNKVTGQAPFTIGHSPIQGNSRQPNSDFYWVAAGSDFLTDANAQTINSFGNVDHARADFPGNATFMWDASSDRYNNR